MIDTIVAQATPPGYGGVSIVRISGPFVLPIMKAIVKRELSPRVASATVFYDEENAIIDEGIAIYFPHPHSFTGEDVLELQGHGGPVVVDLLLQRCLSLGARLARPGEFSERAFLNGKMDLTQAEAVADLIHASSQQAAKLAMRSLQGEFSKKIQTLVEAIIYLRMYVEASIDFAEEEIDFLADEKIHNQLLQIITHVTDIQTKAQQGCLLKEGLTVAIIGEPNVGKSSLLNWLSGQETAIVTDIPGTTRDLLRETILMDGLPIHIVDTAGLRDGADTVEQEGIRRAQQAMQKADLILYVMDARAGHEASLLRGAIYVTGQYKITEDLAKKVILIRNKIDLLNESPSVKKDGIITVSLSVKEQQGLDLLRSCITQYAGLDAERVEGMFLARRRHLNALARAKTALETGYQQLQHQAGELLAEELRQAQQALNEITGEFTSNDLLTRIFSSFCIGK
ncbi:MAG: tRNA uridine-5-carboxymethylaminomethyl(34) synthesis GTPase MnmE [Gammaproteobacteria bacterium RIFCSPHIGHO2_12_FULL_41_20]|nr:MAG: tRNA uridine-5-carboxymethylaminomethyl(34) synthesis GTPase MnmE [Gammaproteobacteria bacterium RIFCSPHIGHO2_12_FULL_41_20]